MMNEERIIFSIIEYIEYLKKNNVYDIENLDVASQCLSVASSIDINDNNKRAELKLNNLTLQEIFRAGLEALRVDLNEGSNILDSPVIIQNRELWEKWLKTLEGKGFFKGAAEGTEEYDNRIAKAFAKFKEKIANDKQDTLTEEQRHDMAEKLKAEGNIALNLKQYEKANTLYQKAAKICPNGQNSHIYYANAGAALMHLGKYQECIKNCEKAFELNPKYVKAYSRLGAAQYQLGEYELALDAYRRGLEIDSSNATCLEGVKDIETAMSQKSTVPTTNTGSATNVPDMRNMFGAGSGGLADLLSNPEMRKAAANMMQNPQMMQMAQNLMGNPSMVNDMFRSFGGAAGSNGTESTTSDSASAITPDMFQKIMSHPKVTELRKDPEMSEFFNDVDSNGPTAALRYMNNQKIMEKLKGLF